MYGSSPILVLLVFVIVLSPWRYLASRNRRSRQGVEIASRATQRRRSISRGPENVHYSDGIVVEDGRDVFGGKLIRCVADEKTCLAYGTVTDDDAPGVRALAEGPLL